MGEGDDKLWRQKGGRGEGRVRRARQDEREKPVGLQCLTHQSFYTRFMASTEDVTLRLDSKANQSFSAQPLLN